MRQTPMHFEADLDRYASTGTERILIRLSTLSAPCADLTSPLLTSKISRGHARGCAKSAREIGRLTKPCPHTHLGN